MQVLCSNWKSNILNELKENHRQQNSYEELIENYNRLYESNTLLHAQCAKLGKDVHHLRLANASLERASGASTELDNVNNKLQATNDELLTHLREKSELTREILRLNRALQESHEKLFQEETKARQYQSENVQLHEKLKSAEVEIYHLTQTKQTIFDEIQALKSQHDLLKIDHRQLKPTCLRLEQELQSLQRANKQLEDEVVRVKNREAELHDLENARFNSRVSKKVERLPPNGTGIFLDDDLVIIPSDFASTNLINTNAPGAVHLDSMYCSYNESLSRGRKGSTSSSNVSNLINGLVRKLTHGNNISSNDRLYRTSINCLSASIPRHEVTQWDCTQLEVYCLLFQPSGSILATGCSDKMVHLWEISSTGQQNKYCSLNCNNGAINALDFDNEGYRLLAACSADKAYVWSYGEQRMLKDVLTGHTGLISTCKFVSGSKLITGSADRTIRNWDLNTRQCTRSIAVGSKCHDLVVIDAVGSIISGHYDHKIRLWDSYTDKCRLTLSYDAAITSLAYNAERHQLLACLKDDTLALIDLRQNQTLQTLSHENFKVGTDTTRAVLSPDGRYACAGSQDGSIVVWNLEEQRCEHVLKRRHSTMVTSVAWQPDGKYLASCEKQRRVILWSD